MSNNAGINIFKKHNLFTQERTYSLEIFDDYACTSIEMPEKDYTIERLKLLEFVANQQKYNDIHGGDSCDTIKQIFDYIVENQKGISIGHKYFNWETIKSILYSEFSNPFALYFVDDNPNDADYNEKKTQKAKNISNKLIKILDKMVKDIGSLKDIDIDERIMEPVGEKIKVLHKEKVGLSDTYSREKICLYVERELKLLTDPPIAKNIADVFSLMI